MLFAFSQQQQSSLDGVQTTDANDHPKNDERNFDQSESSESDEQVTIIIGASREYFSIQKLSQLSYFKARFSSRWMCNKPNRQHQIEIFPRKNNHDQNSNNIDTFDSNQLQIDCKFTCRDLQILLQCVEVLKIPDNICLELSELESLLYCSDYLNPVQAHNNDDDDTDDKTFFTVDQAAIVDYIRNRIPSLHKAKRDEFLRDCSHPTIRNALLQLSDEYKTIMQESDSGLFYKLVNHSSGDDKWNGGYNFIKSLMNRIELDAQTATRLFEKHFKIVTKYQILASKKAAAMAQLQSMTDEKVLDAVSQQYILHIGIEGFDEILDDSDTDTILTDLWDKCAGGRYLSASSFEQIDDMIGKILNPKMNNCTIVPLSASSSAAGEHDETLLIGYILVCVLHEIIDKKLKYNDRRLGKTEYINVCSLIQAIVRLTSKNKGILAFHSDMWHWFGATKLLTEHENEMLVKTMFQVTNDYFPRSVMHDSNLDDLRYSRKSINNWLALLGNGLLGCSKQFVTREMATWFPIMHEKTRKWLMAAVTGVKKTSNYKQNIEEKDKKDKNDQSDHSDYFDDAMIEEIVKLKFEWEKYYAKWIIDKLIKTTDQCFEFGIYLSKYAVFDQNKENNSSRLISFPQQYVDFMQTHCGINWKFF